METAVSVHILKKTMEKLEQDEECQETAMAIKSAINKIKKISVANPEFLSDKIKNFINQKLNHCESLINHKIEEVLNENKFD